MSDADTIQQRIDQIDQQIAALRSEREELYKQQRLAAFAQIERDSAAFAEALHTWQQEQGYLNLKEYSDKYGLHWREVEAGVKSGVIVGYLPPARFLDRAVSQPIGSYYFADAAPTDEQRLAMRQQTYFGRGDAALYLGISEREFDRRRKARALQPAKHAPTSSGWTANLYRLSDIETLR